MKFSFFMLIGFLFTLFMTNASADDIVGKWKLINDKTGFYEANVVISKNSDSTFEGKIDEVYHLPNTKNSKDKCTACTGKLNNHSIIGFPLLTQFVVNPKNSDEYINGFIVDPDNGKRYKGLIRVASNGRKLTITGYIGTSILGRTQTWIRSKD